MISRLRAIALTTCVFSSAFAACDGAPSTDEGTGAAPQSLDFRTTPVGLVASSASSHLDLVADLRGLTVRTTQHEVAFRTESVARAGAHRPMPETSPQAVGPRVDFQRGDVREWFENGAHGVEHGLDLSTPPPGAGVIEIDVTVEGDLHPVLVGTAIELDDDQGMPRARYTNLVVNDATGRRLPAQLAVRRGDIVIRVDDAGATYPIAIDPLVTTDVTELQASDAAAGDEFGGTPFETSGGPSVAVSGNTAVVAAPWDGGGSGGVYVFVRSGVTWSQQARLVAPVGLSAAARFGYSVALEGDRIVVGAPLFDTGRAFVYVRSGTTWSVEDELVAPGVLAGEQFGVAVATDGTTAVVGARYDDRTTAGGAVHVFDRSGSTWTHRARLKASDQAAGDDVGSAVAVDGGTILVGGIFHTSPSFAGAAWVFTGSGATWTQQAKLVGAEVDPLDQFARSLWLDGDVAVIGAPQHADTLFQQGAAFVFTRSMSSWSQTARLLASDAAVGDQLGYSVAVTARVLAAGARFDDRPMPAAADAGAVYLYELVGTTWTQREEQVAANYAAGDRYGDSVALSTDTLVVGAPFTDRTAANAGSAYIVNVAVGLDDGSACTMGTQCGSGFCTDGVCCATACSGGTADCQACSTAAGGTTNGTCTALSATAAPMVTCRAAAAGGCDVAETCVSTSTTCPADGFAPSTTTCTGTSNGGACDAASDRCSGTANTCVDRFVASGTTCRMSAGQCDVAETCSGTSGSCPADGFASSATTCTGTSNGGACDAADRCSGSANTCVDVFVASGTTCRMSAGQCDVAEACSGTSGSCPANGFAPSTTTCTGTSNGGACDAVADRCSGSANTCVDVFLASGSTCRMSTGTCDVAESCSGTSGSCPADGFAPSTTTCTGTSNGGACDATSDRCSGTASTCVDVFLASGTTCRMSAGTCDVAESCSGTSGACPPDTVRPSSHTCRPSVGDCDVAETCTGTSPTCPATDVAATPGAACGGAPSGACDAQDTCSGTVGASATCVARFAPSSTTCRASVGDCDLAESCSGTSATCPSDAAAAPGTACGGAPSGACDLQDTCSGTVGASATCTVNVRPSSFTCRPATASGCDVAENCNGTAPTCPSDAARPVGSTCGGAPSGVCDAQDVCAGTIGAMASCVATFAPTSLVCRAGAGPCDLEERCTGASTACPADVFAGPDNICSRAGGDCDVDDVCTGTSPLCPNNMVPLGTVCRASMGVCDMEEVCSGAASCPTDRARPDGSACSNTTTCDGAEVCAAGACASPGPLDCDDMNACTSDMCSEPGGCGTAPVPGCCNLDGDCTDDGDVCTTERCDGPGGMCMSLPIADCCTDDADCTAGGMCVSVSCNTTTNRCVSAPIAGCCTADADCGDGDACTADTCDAGTRTCTNTAIPSCCVGDGDCDDADTCTADACEIPSGGGAGTCAATAIPGCCELDADCMDGDGDACTVPSCNTVTGLCIETALDCDDMDLCTVDACEMDGTCSHTALDCDDMDDCTADSCGSDGRCANDPIPGCAMPDGGMLDAGVSGDAGPREDAGRFPIDAGFTNDAATARGDAARDVGDLTLVDANFAGQDAGDLTTTNGCGCTIPGQNADGRGLALATLSLLGLVAARRRRRV